MGRISCPPTVGAGGGAVDDLRLLDRLYSQPLVDAGWVQRTMGVSPTTANTMLDRACSVGILRETTGDVRHPLYRYDAYLGLFSAPHAWTFDDTHS